MHKNDAKAQIQECYHDVRDLKEAIDDDDIMETLDELADSNISVYTYDLIQWWSENWNRFDDEAVFAEMGTKPSISRAIAHCWFQDNLEALEEALEELKEEMKEDSKEEED